jgi:hypothetical protein
VQSKELIRANKIRNRVKITLTDRRRGSARSGRYVEPVREWTIWVDGERIGVVHGVHVGGRWSSTVVYVAILVGTGAALQDLGEFESLHAIKAELYRDLEWRDRLAAESFDEVMTGLFD